jgi:predicted DsbA family dithiol-disulfide isomerase
VTVSWSFFPLHPETPESGLALTDLFKGRESQLEGFQRQLSEVAAREGLPYGNRVMTYNSRLAQELGSWADSLPTTADGFLPTTADGSLPTTADGPLPTPADRLHDLIYRAYFVDNQNISDIDVLIDLAGKSGLDSVEARRVLLERTESDKIDRDWIRARNMGISGVPTFASADLVVVGCQTYDILMRFVDHLKKLKLAS